MIRRTTLRSPLRSTTRAIAALALTFVLVSATTGCQQVGLVEREVDPSATLEPEAPEPDRVVVQHCLIGYEGAALTGVTRTLAEAEEMAGRVLAQARGGADFAELVALNTDDHTGDGTYAITNWNVPVRERSDVERGKLVRGFGDAAFAMDVGEIRLVAHDESRSPFGFHVIKRLR